MFSFANFLIDLEDIVSIDFIKENYNYILKPCW